MKRVRGAIERGWDRWSPKLTRWSYHFTPVIAFLLIGLVYYLGVRSERTGFVSEVLDPGLKRITQPVLNAFRGGPPPVDRIVLRITSENVDSLLAVRDSAIASGWLHADANPRYPVRVAFGEYEIDGLLNLDEGPAERLSADRWPFELRIQNGDTLFRMQAFDMAPVYDMQAVRSWLMQEFRRQIGDPAYHTHLVELRANRTDLGLYSLHGRADSMTLADWGRGRGPVLRFDDDLLAGARSAMSERTFPAARPPQADWLVAPVIASRQEFILNDPITARRHERSVGRLEELRAGRLDLDEVFDVPALARAFALSDLLGGQDAMEWYDLQFLADSVSDRLVVIPQRGSSGNAITTILALRSGTPIDPEGDRSDFHQMLFNDMEFYRQYVAYLDTFSADGWLETMLERVKDRLDHYDKIISSEYPRQVFDRSVLQHDRMIIQQTLRPKDLVLAYTQSMGRNERRLAVANVHSLPVEAVGYISGSDTTMLRKPLLLLPRERDKPLDYSVLGTDKPEVAGQTEKLLVRVLGMDELHATTIRTWSTFIAN